MLMMLACLCHADRAWLMRTACFCSLPRGRPADPYGARLYRPWLRRRPADAHDAALYLRVPDRATG